MARLTYTEAAVQSIYEIHSYIARDSRDAAARLVRRLRTEATSLRAFPQRGRMVPEYTDPRIRELIVGNYRLIYLWVADEDLVRILTVYHGARQLPYHPPTGE